MLISNLINELTAMKEKHGDIIVCRTESHDYWGTLYYPITKDSIKFTEHAQPDGPKKPSQQAIAFESNF